MPDARASAGFSSEARIRKSESRSRQHQIACHHHQSRDQDDDEPPRGKLHGAETDRSADRFRDRDVEAADQAANDLPDDQPERIGSEHRDNRRCVKSPDHQPFQHKAQRADRERSEHHSEPDRRSRVMHDIGDVCAEQNEFPLGKVEDAHHAGDDAKSEHDQNDDRAKTYDLEQCDEQIIHTASPATPHPSAIYMAFQSPDCSKACAAR